ncbi:MAG: anthranilate synthase component, partial [Chloroflexi bacterium]|nr:anthranilate synthase component [Chloroflexota bacterium]
MAHTPSLQDAVRLRGSAALLPIYRECLADTETPVSAYMKLRGAEPSFLLESVEGGERQGRYSIVGTAPTDVLRFANGECERRGAAAGTTRFACADPLQVTDDLLKERRAVSVDALPRFHGGAIGYLGFDLIRCYENVGPAKQDPYDLPLAHLAFCDTLVVFDHVKHTIKVVSHARLNQDVASEYLAATERIDAVLARLRQAPPLGASDAMIADVPHGLVRAPVADSNMTRARYEAMVETAREYIAAGDIFQVVLAQRFSVPTAASALDIYRALRVVNPSPYMYLLDFGDYQLVGSS